jgi:hypothetical protein
MIEYSDYASQDERADLRSLAAGIGLSLEF